MAAPAGFPPPLRGRARVGGRRMPSDLARDLRQRPTDAERRLWHRLRNRQLDGCKFRRQVALGRYVADFVCLQARLVVEVDGGQHEWHAKADEARTSWLEANGFHVLRFWNNELCDNLAGVLDTIRRNLPPTPALPRKGGGSTNSPAI